MSRVYFHSPSGTAELRGSERAWLNHVARGPAAVAWDIKPDGTYALERAAELLAMVPEVDDGEFGSNYLHRYLREAQAQAAANKAAYEGRRPGTPLRGNVDHKPARQLVSALATRLRVDGVKLVVAGVELHSDNVELNTALVAGSDPVRVAAKIYGWCESHAWVEGEDRAWLADIIDEGLKIGLYRRGLWYVDGPSDVPPHQHPDRKWSTQGWEEVQALLRSRDDEPVVMSYSVTDQFPNRNTAGWEPPPMPEGWEPGWADTDEGHAEWERDYPTPADKTAYYADTAADQWYDLPEDERWRRAMNGLREQQPWARLAPDTLASVTFHLPVTVYDLFAPDRDERVRAAAELAEVESVDVEVSGS